MEKSRHMELAMKVEGMVVHVNNAHCDRCLQSMASDVLSIANEVYKDDQPPSGPAKLHLAHIIDQLNAQADQRSLAAVVDASLRYLQYVFSQDFS